MTIDSIIQDRPLLEIYLKPFEIAVRDAEPWALMSSDNLVNGIHAYMHFHIFKDILRCEWRYDGYGNLAKRICKLFTPLQDGHVR